MEPGAAAAGAVASVQTAGQVGRMAVDARPAQGQRSDVPARTPRAVRLVRVAAWALIAAGAVVALYLVYSLWFTNLQTAAAQDDMRAQWTAQVGPVDAGAPAPPPATPAAGATQQSVGDPVDDPGPTAAPVDPDPADDPVVGGTATGPEAPTGDAVALVWFERPGGPAPVTDEPYVVVSGVSLADLARGPGHYPSTAGPGEEGNFAVAGHRTTHGAPFFRLDDLTEGDEIHVMDTGGRTHVYRYVTQRVVAPTTVSVLGDDPLGVEGDTVTLTTCHPRFSNRQRLVVVGELVT